MEASQATGKVQLKQPQIPSQHIILGKLSSVRGRSRGRGRLTAAQARPAVRQRHTVRPRMKRLFQEDALALLYPSDEERARRKQQLEQEDKADATLLFDI
ncbi:TPA: hypothetical protein ACH3X2_004092 [Trebouxia sp. C0005]